jgi:hypothetical protein
MKTKMKKMQAGGSIPKMPDFRSPEDRTPKEKREGKRQLKKTMSYVKKHGSGLKMQMGGSKSEQQTASRKAALADSTTKFPYTSTSGAMYATRKDLMEGRPTNPAKIKQGTKMKTGGMVNANSKVSKQTVPGSKGVKSGVNPKAASSKVATGRSGGTSTAPKTALPKAQLGKIVKMVSGAGKASSASKAGSQAAKKTMAGLNDLKKRGIDFRTTATKKDLQKALTNTERARLKKVLQQAEKFKP